MTDKEFLLYSDKVLELTKANARLRDRNDELRHSVQTLLDGLVGMAPHAARARGILDTIEKEGPIE